MHRWKAPGRRAAAGLRIDEPDAEQTLELSTPVRAQLRIAGAARRAALVATSALIAAVAAGTALALIAQTSPRPVSVASARARAERRIVLHARPRSLPPPISPVPGAGARAARDGAPPAFAHASAAISATAAQPRSTAVPCSSATELQADGHRLLGEARYANAIAELRAALLASGESTARCGVPVSEMCLTYAYALYDLGRALLLDGDPRAALGVLSERLQIDNQRATVQEELDLARAADAGATAAPLLRERARETAPFPRKVRDFS